MVNQRTTNLFVAIASEVIAAAASDAGVEAHLVALTGFQMGVSLALTHPDIAREWQIGMGADTFLAGLLFDTPEEWRIALLGAAEKRPSGNDPPGGDA